MFLFVRDSPSDPAAVLSVGVTPEWNEMTILSPCKPIAVRHQWNMIVSGYPELTLMTILCCQFDVKLHVFIARDRRIVHNNISFNKLVGQTN